MELRSFCLQKLIFLEAPVMNDAVIISIYGHDAGIYDINVGNDILFECIPSCGFFVRSISCGGKFSSFY